MRGEQEPRPTQVPHKAALVLNWLGDDNVPEVIPAHKQHWLWPRPWRVITGLIIAFSIWGWLDVRNRGQIDPNWRWSHKTDFTVYTEAGAAFFDGREPYEVTNPRGWGYLYPPLFAILVAPLHAIDSRNQVFVWFVISVLMGWGCYREIIRIGRHVLPERKRQGAFGSIPTWFGVAAVTAAMLPALNCLQRGQVGVAKLYLLLLGFRLLLENPVLVRPVLGGIALAAAVTLKITPALPAAIAVGGQCVAAWYARTKSRWQRAGASVAGLCGGLALTLLIVPALFVGWRANLGHLETWWDTVAIRAESTSQEDFAGNSTSVRNQSLANASYRFGNWIHYYFAGGPYDDNGPEQLRLGGQGLLMSAPWAKRAVFAVRFLAGCLALVLAFKMARARCAGTGRVVWDGVRRHARRVHDRPRTLLRLAAAGRVVRSTMAAARGTPPRGRHGRRRAVRAGDHALRAAENRGTRRPAGARHDAVVLFDERGCSCDLRDFLRRRMRTLRTRRRRTSTSERWRLEPH